MNSETLQHSTAQPVVSLRRVSKIYGEGTGRVAALDEVSVDIHRGGFTAIMGPSGSGRSTFMNVAAGLDDATSGEVMLAGAAELFGVHVSTSASSSSSSRRSSRPSASSARCRCPSSNVTARSDS